MAKKKATEAGELKERLKSWQADKPDLFKAPDYDADYQHWVQMRYWTAHEAVTLSLGKDPNKIPRDRITSLRPDSYAEDSFPVRYTKRFQVLNSHLPELAVERIDAEYRSLAKLQPGAFVQWATVKGWDLPKEIMAVKKKKRRNKQAPPDPLEKNPKWNQIESATRKAIGAYQKWRGPQKPRAEDVLGWLRDQFRLTVHESRLVKDVLEDHFDEFP